MEMTSEYIQGKTAHFEPTRSLDQNTLEAIFDENAPRLYGYLIRLGSGPQEADQMVGDVFARLLEKLSEGKGPRTNLRSYLFQTAYHLFIDHARDRKFKTSLVIAETVETEPDSVQKQSEESILLDTLAVAIKQDLTEEQRNVIVLRYLEGFSLRETAEIMGKKVNAIKALQYRGMSRLQEVMNSEKGGNEDA